MADEQQIRVVITGVASDLRRALEGAKGDLGGLSRAIREVPDKIKVDVRAETLAALGRLRELKDAAKDVPNDIRIQADADTGIATAKLRLLERQARQTEESIARAQLGSLISGGGGGGFGRTFASGLTSGGLPGAGPLAVGTAAAPLAAGAVGSAIPIIGSAGAGLLGLGALATSVLGIGGVGLGSMLGVLVQAKTNISNVTAAMDALEKAQANYGASSKQAQQAQQNLNTVMAEAGPQASEIAKQLGALGDQWTKVSAPATQALDNIIIPALKVVRDLMPTVAGIAKQAFDAIHRALQPVFDGLSSPAFKKVLTDLGDAFAKLAGPAIGAFSNLMRAFFSVAVAASPYVIQIAQAFERWTKSFAESLSPGAHLNALMKDLVGQAHSWWELTVALGHVLVTVFKAGADQGQQLVGQLTQLLDKWNAWLNTTAGQAAMHKFFSESLGLLKSVAGVLGAIAPLLANLAVGLIPVMSELLKPLAELLSTVSHWINDLSSHLPPVIKALPGLAVAVGVLASWKALKALVDATTTAMLGKVGLGGAAAGAGKGASGGLSTAESVGGGAAGGGLLAVLGKLAAMPAVRVGGPITAFLATFFANVDSAGGSAAKAAPAIDQLRQAFSGSSWGNIAKIKDNLNLFSFELDPKAAASIQRVTDKVSAFQRTVGGLTAVWPSQAQTIIGNFQAIDVHGSAALDQFHLAVQTNMDYIASHTTSGSVQSKEAIALNFREAAQFMQQNYVAMGVGTKVAMDEINKLLREELGALGVKNIPKNFSTANLNFLASNGTQGATATLTPTPPGHYSGGKVTQPGYFAGEEAPAHPEYILATNPAYRDRNLGLWASAGRELGVPGFATGGIAGGRMGRMIAEANQISSHHYPYVWGGGHSSFAGPYDCSGAVSAVLHAGGLLASPEVSGDMMSLGLPGPGQVTLYASPSHVYMSLDGRFFGTSGANPGGGAGWFAGAPRPGFVVRHFDPGGSGAGTGMIGAPKWTGPGGVAGAVGRGAVATATAAANAFLTRMTPGFGGGGGGGNLNENAANQTLGRSMMLAAGFPASQWPALRALWSQESGWDANAVNPSSGAYGIPQALGHGHPYALGDPRAQIRWGLDYIKGRYGSPSVAEAHERAFNWYAKGGVYRGFARGGIAHTAASRPPKAPAIKHPKTPKVHVPHTISDALKRLLPVDVAHLDTAAAGYAQHQVDLSTADDQLTYTQGLPPYPAQPLVTLSDADVAALDPTGQLGYQTGDQLVNQSGMTVGRFFGPTGISGGSWVPGIDQRQHQISDQLTNLYAQRSALADPRHSASALYGQAIAAELAARSKRADRRARVFAFLRRQVIRAKAIQAELKAITTGNLQRNLRTLLSKQAISGRLSTLRQDKTAISAELAAEKHSQSQLIPIEQDPTHTNELTAQLEKINQSIGVEQQLSTSGAASAAVSNAKLALYKNSLTNRLASYATVDKNLGGSPYDVGTGGIAGTLQKQIDAIDAQRVTDTASKLALAPALQTIGNAIAAYVTESAGLPGTSAVQVRTPGTTTPPGQTALDQLLGQQLATTQANLALSQSQFGVLQGFAPLLAGRLVGSFQSGIDFVPATGLAMVHKGETILPDPSGPAGNRAAATVQTAQGPIEITIVMGNNDEPLMKVVSAQMNQKALRIVSDQSGQRARLMAGVRRP